MGYLHILKNCSKNEIMTPVFMIGFYFIHECCVKEIIKFENKISKYLEQLFLTIVVYTYVPDLLTIFWGGSFVQKLTWEIDSTNGNAIYSTRGGWDSLSLNEIIQSIIDWKPV